jgi:hypothetical protein
MFPDSFVTETPTAVASELLALLHGRPMSGGLRVWLSDLRRQVRDAEAQDALFG